MYINPNLQRYHRAMSGRAGNKEGRYFQKMVNSWLSAFIQSEPELLLQKNMVDIGC